MASAKKSSKVQIDAFPELAHPTVQPVVRDLWEIRVDHREEILRRWYGTLIREAARLDND